MSGKTKAQLLEENRELQARVDFLLRMQAADHDTIKTLSELIDSLDHDLRVTDQSNDDLIQKYVPLLQDYLEGADKARSDAARHAANVRHKLPEPTLGAVHVEAAAVREQLKSEGKNPYNKTVCRTISQRLWGTDKHWRRIDTQLKKRATK